MSHNGPITCPNCGSEAEKNYCSQCGQATHLHDETFGSLVMHFFAHYFHYESKFWQTVKTLCTRPGALTIAYRKKQRARFVPPVSLYIFVVIAYFVLSSLIETVYKKYDVGLAAPQQENTARAKENPEPMDKLIGKQNKEKILHIIDHADEYNAKVMNYLPKIFLFLPPIFALLLALLFIDRRGFLYVDHAVFSFHLHIPVFFILLLSDLIPAESVSDKIIGWGLIGWLFYSMRAMTVVYGIHWFRALISSALAITIDLLVFMALFVLLLLKLF